MNKDLDIRLADMTYIDSCVEILQDSVLGKAYFSDHKKATDMLSYAVAQKTFMLLWMKMENVWGLSTT